VVGGIAHPTIRHQRPGQTRRVGSQRAGRAKKRLCSKKRPSVAHRCGAEQAANRVKSADAKDRCSGQEHPVAERVAIEGKEPARRRAAEILDQTADQIRRLKRVTKDFQEAALDQPLQHRAPDSFRTAQVWQTRYPSPLALYTA
jgi:hypothetical protein